MNHTILYALWGGLYALCAGLGFIPSPEGIGKLMLTALSVVFFVPPLVLVHRAVRQKDNRTLKLIRNLSALWLLLTLVLLVANVLSIYASEAVGNFLYTLLVIVSSPMVCSQHWIVSLFLFAYVMFAAIFAQKKK